MRIVDEQGERYVEPGSFTLLWADRSQTREAFCFSGNVSLRRFPGEVRTGLCNIRRLAMGRGHRNGLQSI